MVLRAGCAKTNWGIRSLPIGMEGNSYCGFVPKECHEDGVIVGVGGIEDVVKH